jgi:hypothetical protein
MHKNSKTDLTITLLYRKLEYEHIPYACTKIMQLLYIYILAEADNYKKSWNTDIYIYIYIYIYAPIYLAVSVSLAWRTII